MPGRGTRFSAVDLISWLTVAFVGLITLSQAVGRSGFAVVAVTQSLTPYLAVALVAVVIVALIRRRLMIVTVATAAAFGIAVVGTPLAFPNPQPVAAAGTTGLRIASLNLWYQNPDIDAVADVVATLDADVIVFSEYTRGHQAALEASALADEYPYRLQRQELNATGIGVWSRFPTASPEELADSDDSVAVVVRAPDGDVHVVAMHLPTPISDVEAWRNELAAAARIGRDAVEPTLLIGDLNSSYWHPPFRRLLDVGFVDAHVADGAGFTTSWPTDWWLPPFVRLDHALTTGGLVSTDVDDFEIPGSDHRGLVVTVAPAR